MKARDPAQLARAAARIREQLTALGRVVGAIHEALARWDDSPQDAVTVHWVGGLVHDLYTGLERAFSAVSPELNGIDSEGAAWHRDLLHAMTLDLAGVRPPVLRQELEPSLSELLRFRHLYRNLYSFELRWERVRTLASEALLVWPDVEHDLQAFARALDTLAQA